ncbi:Mitochondrial proton/calcium exchanger protein [Plasmodiophora brassicae]
MLTIRRFVGAAGRPAVMRSASRPALASARQYSPMTTHPRRTTILLVCGRTTPWSPARYPLSLQRASFLDGYPYRMSSYRWLSTSPTQSDSSVTSADKPPPPKSKWEHAKETMWHYWNGCKLLAANVSTAVKLVRKSTTGKKLTRRERKLLTTTAADLARFVPFAFFIIIPFLELALPLFLYLFPNMLPSTFQDKHKKEEMMKKQLKLRLELAEFLQETTEVVAKNMTDKGSKEARERADRLVRLLARVREGKYITNDDVVQLASLFEDEFTLEHLSREQLASLSRYMGINTYGRSSRLQYELLKRLEEIREDDRAIVEEGIDSLTLSELRTAVGQRGMRALGVPEHVLKGQLQGWLDLSLNQSIPPGLLLLSRVFTLNQAERPGTPLQAIKSTLARLDDKIVEDVIDETTKPADNAQKLEDVKFQLELLKEEEEDWKEKEKIIKEKEKEKEETKEKNAAEEIRTSPKEELPDDSFVGPPVTPAVPSTVPGEQAAGELTAEEARARLKKLTEIGEELAVLSDESAVSQEREKLEELTAKWSELEKVASAREDHHLPETFDRAPKLEQVPAKEDEPPSEPTKEEAAESAVQARLKQKVGSMLAELRGDIDRADSKIGDKLRVLDQDHDGVMSYEEVVDALRNSLKECKSDEEAREIVKALDIKQDGKIDTDELRKFIRSSAKDASSKDGSDSGAR